MILIHLVLSRRKDNCRNGFGKYSNAFISMKRYLIKAYLARSLYN